MTIDQVFTKLSKSKFRSKFDLDDKDIKYIDQKGFDIIESHARDFVRTRLAPDVIPNDGKQTPMRGHPVFKSQHACACCCRSCLYKWYKVPMGINLSEECQNNIVNLLMTWIKRKYDDKKIIKDKK